MICFELLWCRSQALAHSSSRLPEPSATQRCLRSVRCRLAAVIYGRCSAALSGLDAHEVEFMPLFPWDGHLQAVDRGQEMASKVKDGAKEMNNSKGLGIDEATSTIKDTAQGVMSAASGKSEE